MFRTNRKSLMVVILLIGILVSGCNESHDEPVEETSGGSGVGIANPASVYCEGLGYELKLVSDELGSHGICVFPDGSECEEWDFLSGRCGQEHSYCVREGYVLEAEEESNIGKCVFPDGSTCLEIDFFEDRCGPED